MANFNHLAVCALLSIFLCIEIVHGLPLSAEDVVSLLPEIPKTKNETVAAIVEDAVVQDAVQSVVGDGTLSGLVVKKNTVILPADKPDVILGQNEQILAAPLSQLENIRKNITETAATISEKENSEVTAIDEISLSEIVPLDDKTGEDPLEILTADSLVLDKGESSTKLPQFVPEITVGEKIEVPGIEESDAKLPQGIIPDNIVLPVAIHDEVAAPVVAVWNPNNLSTVQESVIDLLPSLVESSITTTGGKNLNPTEAKKEVPEYGTRIPVAVVTSEELDHPAVKIEERRALDEEKPARNVVAAFLVAEDKSSYYENDDNDMVAAEDIIFRPLFRYRQQQNDRLRILENRAYQKAGNTRYRPSSSFDNYNSRKNPYRKSQRTRYYNDYY